MKVTPEILKALNRANWNGRKVSVEIAGEDHAAGETSRHCTQYDFILVQREDKKYQRTALVQASERGTGSFHGGFRRKKKRAGAERGLLCFLHSIHAV